MADDNAREPSEDRTGESAPLCGDPSLQLFSQGWTPTAQDHEPETYRGRHRAPE